MTQTELLDPKRIAICKESGTLRLSHAGQTTEIAPPKRALPLSSPDEWIVLSSAQGDEIGIVRRVSELDPISRELMRQALERAYRITTILRVLEVEREPVSGQIEWRVEIEDDQPASEDGRSGREVTFRLAGGEDIQTARYPHIYFSDVDGQRFQILNCEAMDLASRRASERYF